MFNIPSIPLSWICIIACTQLFGCRSLQYQLRLLLRPRSSRGFSLYLLQAFDYDHLARQPAHFFQHPGNHFLSAGRTRPTVWDHGPAHLPLSTALLWTDRAPPSLRRIWSPGTAAPWERRRLHGADASGRTVRNTKEATSSILQDQRLRSRTRPHPSTSTRTTFGAKAVGTASRIGQEYIFLSTCEHEYGGRRRSPLSPGSQGGRGALN